MDTELTVDSPAAALVEASARAGLVVLPRHPVEGRLGLHLGTVVHAVLHHARCPVAVVPTGQAAVAGVHVVRRRPDGAAGRPPARLTSRTCVRLAAAEGSAQPGRCDALPRHAGTPAHRRPSRRRADAARPRDRFAD
nr:universal stress protein [Streptomyces sp. TRM72054]